MKPLYKMILGFTITNIALFGGSYVLHIFSFGHWLNFPLFMVACFLFFYGAWVFSSGLHDYEKQKQKK